MNDIETDELIRNIDISKAVKKFFPDSPVITANEFRSNLKNLSIKFLSYCDEHHPKNS